MKYHTWISKRQIGVIFSNWKKGNLNLTEEQIKWLYDHCAEVKCFNNNMSFEDVLCRVNRGINCIFENDYAEAEKAISGAYDLYKTIYA